MNVISQANLPVDIHPCSKNANEDVSGEWSSYMSTVLDIRQGSKTIDGYFAQTTPSG